MVPRSEPEDPDDPEGLEALRRRLYRRGARDGDVADYLERAARTSAPGPAPMGDVAAAPRRRRPDRAALAVAAAALVVLGLTGLLAPRPAPAPPAPDRGVLLPGGVLDAAGDRAARQLLSGAPASGAARRFGGLVSTAFVESGASDALVVTGGGAGPRTVRLGSLGVTAQGHALTVVVATTADRYAWRLTGVAHGRPTVLASAASGRVRTVTGSAVGVPPHVPADMLRIDVPSGERVLYALVLSG